MAVQIGLTGDVMLGRLVDERQHQRPVTAVWGDLLGHLRGLDGLFVNLECCLSTRGTPWRRTPKVFHFRARPGWAIPALCQAEVDCCALANNHVLDFETIALRDTIARLDDAGIAHAGAGQSVGPALEPAVVQVDGLSVAFVSLTDNMPEFAATATTPGTAYIEIDPAKPETRHTVDRALHLARAADPDLLIASLHWGPNMVATPPLSFQRFGRWLVDRGVDVVHGHSAHVFQGIEVYNDGLLLYDTGDFVDDYAVHPTLCNDRSFLFELSVTDEADLTELRLVPTHIDDCSVHSVSPGAVAWWHERMHARSAAFGTPFDRDGKTLVVDLADRTLGSGEDVATSSAPSGQNGNE
jgi:poly-gamma-glutamate synthesis protein (capsule biosynthesis protein)